MEYPRLLNALTSQSAPGAETFLRRRRIRVRLRDMHHVSAHFGAHKSFRSML